MSEVKDGEPRLYSAPRYLYLELYRHEIVNGLLAPSLWPRGGDRESGEFTQPVVCLVYFFSCMYVACTLPVSEWVPRQCSAAFKVDRDRIKDYFTAPERRPSDLRAPFWLVQPSLDGLPLPLCPHLHPHGIISPGKQMAELLHI